MIENIIIIVIVIAIITAIITYLVRAKKRGEHCIGCPYAKQCGGNCHGKTESHHDNK